MTKYICVHGHFYQPPRENAWLEKIEYQDSAAPYHDWNERITQECYGPNGVSRILNEDQKIVDIVNNYARMSFNFGPTLLSWLETFRPKTYAAVLDADQKSMTYFGGHGSAMAQVYNHIIMPLANRRDKETQVIWGLRDFEKRFQRKAEGMWLAETAVDTETLEVLAENGIIFTVLAPRQAKQFRSMNSLTWEQGIDPKVPYLCQLPSGKSINLFFYDGERSQAVAFKGLLKDGKEFANYLVNGFDNRKDNQLLHIATDGESYGHHHRYGDMALAYCLRYIETNNLAKITNYGQYLELNPPKLEVEIHQNSSWSCVHGIERWRSNCGCNTGGRPDWNQKWRKPLRESLDWLREELAEVYERELENYHPEPWKLRNLFIDVILSRTPDKVDRFLLDNFGKLSPVERTHVMRLMEMQRQELLMYTSCGWFFDEISGIETVQILQYACRAIQLAESESSEVLSAAFKAKLSEAISNISNLGNGMNVLEKYVEPSQLTLTQIGMHYAVASLFAEDPNTISVFNYNCQSTHFKRVSQGSQKLAVGRTHIDSRVTLSQKDFSYVVIYLGQHHLIGKAFQDIPLEEYEAFVDKLMKAFSNSNLTEVLELFRLYPEQRSFSFFDMFKDEQIKMLEGILKYGEELAASSYRKINERNYNIINVMRTTHLHPPQMLVNNLEMVLNIELRDLFKSGAHRVNILELRRVVRDIRKWKFKIDHADLNFICANKLNDLLYNLGILSNGTAKKSLDMIENMQNALDLLAKVGVYPELNEIQDAIFTTVKTMEPDVPQEMKNKVFSFAEYINLDVSRFRESRFVL